MMKSPSATPITVSVSLLLLAAVSFLLAACTSGIVEAASTGRKWAYKHELMAYDIECAKKAVEPHKDTEIVKWASRLTPKGHDLIGSIWMARFVTDMQVEAREKVIGDIIDAYVRCSGPVLDVYLSKMGNDGWEMISYTPLEQTYSDGSMSLSIGYGYEVMWKREK